MGKKQKSKGKSGEISADRSGHEAMQQKGAAHYLQEMWTFIWESDHPVSWVLNILLAFVFIKFILYPGLGMVFHTPFPLVAVISGSMEHNVVEDVRGASYTLCGRQYDAEKYALDFESFWKECGQWYENRGITKAMFENFPFKGGFNKGDIILIYGTDAKDLKIGDVIVFQRTSYSEPIIHRVVNISGDMKEGLIFTTKGDHNAGIGQMDILIQEKDILGEGTLRVPFLGYVKVWLTELMQFIRTRV